MGRNFQGGVGLKRRPGASAGLSAGAGSFSFRSKYAPVQLQGASALR